jgi:predicted ATPase/class 3 adenylate cyclase
MLPTGTVTFLFTDIQGSTQLWQGYPQAMAQALARHHELLSQSIEQQHGYVFQIIGDAFCAAFPTAADGLKAALAAQRALGAELWGETGPIKVRMALHSGAAQARAGEYTSGEYLSGLTLSRAARLLSAGHGGQVILSQPTYDLLAYELPAGVTLKDLGLHRLKDLRQPEHIYQLVVTDLPVDFQPLKSLDARPNNLPGQLTSFVGRERELAEIHRLLIGAHETGGGANRVTRLLTLTGVGGAGKTRLALQAAADLIDHFADGVWLVELAALSDPDFLPQSVAAALKIEETPGRPVQETLIDFLHNCELLLVLDNCEHLIEAAARLAENLLCACPKLSILTTSREALSILGESAWSVPSLGLPPGQASIEQIADSAAARLFIQRAMAARPGFELNEANGRAIAQICRRLDGIPLALELAAARVKALTPEQIAARLDDRFRLLTGGSRTALPRQQTLQALIDWSYQLLAEDERLLFRRLGVFYGGWNLEAAEQVCSGERIESDAVLDSLARLVDKSLVLAEEQASEIRYRMLETIRQFARERLLESGEAASLQQRHLAWMLELGQDFDKYWYGFEGASWMKRMDLEHDNLRAALNWGLEQVDSLQTTMDLVGAIWLYWYFRSHWVEGRSWFERALEASAGGMVTPAARGTVLYAEAGFCLFQGEIELAKTYTEASLQACREAGDRLGEAVNLHHAGVIAQIEGRYQEAEELLKIGLKLSWEEKNELWETVLLNDLGYLYAHNLKDSRRAYDFFQQQLAVSRRIGVFTHYALINLAWTCLEMGDMEQARQYLRETEQANRELFEPRLQGLIFQFQAKLAELDGDLQLARQLNLESLEYLWRIRDRDSVLEVLEQLAENAARRHELAEAANLLGAIQAARQQYGLPSARAEQVESLRCSLAEQMGEAAFEAAWTEGQALSLERVVSEFK